MAKAKKKESLLAGPLLIAVTDDKGKTVAFGRSPTGQFFYDCVLSKKSAKYLARKWSLPIADIRNVRKVGRKQMKLPEAHG